MAAQLAAAGLTPKFADLVNMNRPKPQDNAQFAAWYAFTHSGGEFEVCLRPGGVFYAPQYAASSRWCVLPNRSSIAISWGRFGDYKLDVTDAVLRELSGARWADNAACTGPNDWRRMKALRPLSPVELKLLSVTGGGTEWSFEYASGRFAVQFRGDGYNHFSCHSYPAHSHWSLSGDELTINWGQYGVYVMKFTSETTAEGSLKGKSADWRRMKYVRDLDAVEASDTCGHDHDHH